MEMFSAFAIFPGGERKKNWSRDMVNSITRKQRKFRLFLLLPQISTFPPSVAFVKTLVQFPSVHLKGQFSLYLSSYLVCEGKTAGRIKGDV